MSKNADIENRSDPHPNPPHKGEGMTTNLYIRITKWLSIAGCIGVFIFLLRQFPINENPDLAEEYFSMFMIMLWISYCFVGAGASSLVCWLFKSRSIALPFLLVVELIILMYFAEIQSIPLSSTGSEFRILGIFAVFALPLVFGWSVTFNSSPSPLWGGPGWGSLGD